MPKCTADQIKFGRLGRRVVEANFEGGAISSDGGLLMLRQVERRLGLLGAVAETLPDPRSPLLVKHQTEQLLRQRVFGLCQGYEDLNDHDILRNDLAVQTALERDTAGASSPTLCRFENRADRSAAVATSRILVDPAPLRLLRRAVAGRLPASGQEGCGAARCRHPQAAGDAPASGLAAGAHPVPGRLGLLPSVADELVRSQRRRLRHRPGQELAAA